jgi:hypothetical protein
LFDVLLGDAALVVAVSGQSLIGCESNRTLQVVPICNTQNEFAIRVDIKPNVAVMPEHHRRKSSWGA